MTEQGFRALIENDKAGPIHSNEPGGKEFKIVIIWINMPLGVNEKS